MSATDFPVLVEEQNKGVVPRFETRIEPFSLARSAVPSKPCFPWSVSRYKLGLPGRVGRRRGRSSPRILLATRTHAAGEVPLKYE